MLTDISGQWAWLWQALCAERVKRTVCSALRVLVRAAFHGDDQILFFCSFVWGMTERGASR